MLIDFRSADCPDAFTADLCIVGAGPAGITIASSFANTPWRVCLLEGGGLHSERDSQALNHGLSIGPNAFDAGNSRLRTFGGATRVWGGGCIPFSAAEFAHRDWVPESGWPIDRVALDPYYARAADVCGVDPGAFEDGRFLPPDAPSLRTTPSDNLENRTSRNISKDFGRAHLASLASAPNLQVVLHANLLRLEAHDNAAAVHSALIGNLDGRRGRVAARYFVLATGGIENARLLLLSNDVAPAGLGNDHDLVGRYFMDHPRCRLGTYRGGDLDHLAARYSRAIDRAVAPAFHQLSLSSQTQQMLRLPSARARPFAMEQPVPAGLRSLRALRASLRRPAPGTTESDEVERTLLDALADGLPDHAPATTSTVSRRRLALQTTLYSDHVIRAGCRKLARRPAVATDRVEMVGYFEQVPNRDSRISLSDRRDALGLRKVQVDWRLSELDQAGMRESAQVIARDVATHFGCEFQPAEWLRDTSALPRVHGTAHHLGTTRMSDSPTTGVVDPQCRVHGVDNLYVAGSSVFPTGSWTFPTLTIVALALRLTDELRNRMGELSTTLTML